MNEQPNVPMTSDSTDSAGFAGWLSTWMTAVTKSSEQTYAMLAEHPDARSNNRAFTWVFLGGTVSALISGLLQAILELAGFPSQTPTLGQMFGGNAAQGGMLSLGIAICASPIAGILIGCCAVVVITGMASLGIAVSDTFNSINQSLTP